VTSIKRLPAQGPGLLDKSESFLRQANTKATEEAIDKMFSNFPPGSVMARMQ
jgi:hypothetical protein